VNKECPNLGFLSSLFLFFLSSILRRSTMLLKKAFERVLYSQEGGQTAQASASRALGHILENKKERNKKKKQRSMSRCDPSFLTSRRSSWEKT
jgi:hypothetical protein